MSKRFARALAITFLLLGCTALLAQEFSADMVDTKQNGTTTSGKIFVGKTKVRIETEDRPRGGGILIYDMTQQHSYVLMPAQHMYMELGPGRGISRTSEFFRPPDIDNACPEWQKVATEVSKKPLSSCHKVGDDTVDGRAAVKYEGTSGEGDEGFAWIDRSLHFVIKWQGKNGGMELRNIKEGSQSDSLFEVPSDYQKFDMGNMMRNRNPQGPPQP